VFVMAAYCAGAVRKNSKYAAVTDDEIRRVCATVFTNSRYRSVPKPHQPPLAVDSSDELTD